MRTYGISGAHFGRSDGPHVICLTEKKVNESKDPSQEKSPSGHVCSSFISWLHLRCGCVCLLHYSKWRQWHSYIPSIYWDLKTGFVANSKYKIQALFKGPNCIFQAPKLSTESHILDADIQNLDCKYCFQVLVGDMHTSACFKTDNKWKISKFARFKFKDFSRIFKHLICFQALSRALKFLFQIQAFSRISQARYEPCKKYQQLFQTIHPRWVDKVGRWCPRLDARVL